MAAEDLGAPHSWEMADLDETMRRLLVSPPRNSPSRPPPLPPELASAAAVASSTGRAIPDEVIGQVDQFLREALEKPRERLAVLRMEQDVEKFIRDPTQLQLEFQSLPTSYLRLAAHRVAQHYFLQSVALADNSLDGTGSRIVLHKTSECRFPLVRLADIPVNLQPGDNNNAAVKVAIKQRPGKHSQLTSNMNTHSSKNNHQRSVEERKEEYNRARARIFSSSSSGGFVAKSEVEPTLPDGFQHCPLVSTRQGGKTVYEPSEISVGRGLDDSSGGNISPRNRSEKEPVSRYNSINRVAIFRDREVDRKDPDYDRSYDRYMQRFDPGFGFNGGPYTMQPMCNPAVNYNTEFPQLRSGQRPSVSMDHHLRPIPQHIHGHWLAGSTPTPMGYGPPEAMMTPFGPNHLGPHATPPVYMHPSQYPIPPRPGMSFIHLNEHSQHFAQTRQQQPDTSFGLARPR